MPVLDAWTLEDMTKAIAATVRQRGHEITTKPGKVMAGTVPDLTAGVTHLVIPDVSGEALGHQGMTGAAIISQLAYLGCDDSAEHQLMLQRPFQSRKQLGW